MSKSNQLLNIEVGTFKRQGNKLILELNHNQFRYDQLSELNELKQADANFFCSWLTWLSKTKRSF